MNTKKNREQLFLSFTSFASEEYSFRRPKIICACTMKLVTTMICIILFGCDPSQSHNPSQVNKLKIIDYFDKNVPVEYIYSLPTWDDSRHLTQTGPWKLSLVPDDEKHIALSAILRDITVTPFSELSKTGTDSDYRKRAADAHRSLQRTPWPGLSFLTQRHGDVIVKIAILADGRIAISQNEKLVLAGKGSSNLFNILSLLRDYATLDPDSSEVNGGSRPSKGGSS